METDKDLEKQRERKWNQTDASYQQHCWKEEKVKQQTPVETCAKKSSLTNAEDLPRSRLLNVEVLTCRASPGVGDLVNFQRGSSKASICLEYCIKDIIKISTKLTFKVRVYWIQASWFCLLRYIYKQNLQKQSKIRANEHNCALFEEKMCWKKLQLQIISSLFKYPFRISCTFSCT